MRVFVIVLLTVVLVMCAVSALAQLTRWCPAGDGDVVAGVPFGNRDYDLNFNGVVNLPDLAMFATFYPSPPVPYNLCVDFAPAYGLVNLPDFASFAIHYNHAGPVIGLCN